MSRYSQSMSEALREVSENEEVFDEAMKWEVKISGLPTFYSDGKSKGQVRQALRKMLKRPDDIESIERTTPAELKKIRRDQAKGEGGDVKKEEVEDAFDYKAKKGAIAAPGSGSISKVRKARASDFSKSIEQQMKDALKERFNPDDVIRMIQFGHPFKVVDEDIPPELPGEEVPRYKNVSNAVVDKADKKSNKAMAKAEKDTLVPTQTKEQRNTWLEDSEWAQEKRKEKESSERLLKIHKEREARYQMQQRKKREAQAKDKKDQDKDPVGKQHEALKWKVDVAGNPPAYMDGKSAAAVRQRERKIVKRPKDISSITRVTPAEYRKTLRQAAAGKVDLTTPTEDKDWKDMSDQQKKAKAKAQFDAILKKKQGNPKDYKSPIEVRGAKEEVEMDEKAGRAAAERSTRKLTAKKAVASKMGKIRWRQNKGAVEEVEMDEWGDSSILDQQRARIQGRPDTPQNKERDALIKAVGKSPIQQALAKKQAAKKKVSEVAPPGWGHTKAEKEKTKPNKPKSKIGGSAHEFDKDLKSGKFKGLPGDKTYKDKKASMFKIMWAAHNKGDKPHYKPGVKDVKKAKYKNEDVAPSTLEFRARMKARKAKVGRPKEPELLSKFLKRAKEGGYKVKKEENILYSAKRYLNEKADWNTAFKSAAQSRPPMKYKDAVSFIDTAGLNSTEKRGALKAAKKWLR